MTYSRAAKVMATVFRLTCNADLSMDTEDVEDLARALLPSRRYGDGASAVITPTAAADYRLGNSTHSRRSYIELTARST
jgi:polyphosphate kinase